MPTSPTRQFAKSSKHAIATRVARNCFGVLPTAIGSDSFIEWHMSSLQKAAQNIDFGRKAAGGLVPP